MDDVETMKSWSGGGEGRRTDGRWSVKGMGDGRSEAGRVAERAEEAKAILGL